MSIQFCLGNSKAVEHVHDLVTAEDAIRFNAVLVGLERNGQAHIFYKVRASGSISHGNDLIRTDLFNIHDEFKNLLFGIAGDDGLLKLSGDDAVFIRL